MIDRETIASLKLLHGSFNILVFLFFIRQGYLGSKIRKGRKKGLQAVNAVKVHRKTGPFLVLMVVSGFLAGKILVYIDHGHFMEYPLHFSAGSILAVCVMTTFVISRKIKGPEPLWRDRHFRLGIFILCLYFIQIFLGIGILL